ncbi:MAG: HAD family hydrolase [Deltaproteobacteria bacterium]|jgi:D-glycero-D-manno-heptose 1,7-bisphosphate phosphatase|nr:HAD family hydrolase [Deltaproteobacteria bacterium]
MKKNRAVFLDRDGTICEEVGYIDSIERLRLIPRSAAAIKLLNDREFKVVVVTNQSGVARGFFPEELLEELHGELSRQLREEGAHLDGIYYCPHHPHEGNAPYVQVCNCRKPASGLLLRAAFDLGLDLSASYMVGDHFSDVECAQGVGAQGILLLTGHGRQALARKENLARPPALIASDLFEAVNWIVSNSGKQ